MKNLYDLANVTCAECGCKFAIPGALYDTCIKRPDVDFWCPYGHILHFPAKEQEKIEAEIISFPVIRGDKE